MNRRTNDVEIEVQMAELNVKLENIEKNQNAFILDNKEEHAHIGDKLDKFVEAVDKRFKQERSESNTRYAGKPVEKVVWFALGIIATTLIGYAMSHFLAA
jgi:hypothetical protein